MLSDPNSPFLDDYHFEAEVRRVAGLIWPASQVDRSPIIDGRERDAVVRTPDLAIVVEATTSRKKDKIADDSKKTNDLVRKIRSQGFACQGMLVTLHEPTAQQEEVARKYAATVKLQSFDQFLSRLFNASDYIQSRITKRFGSIQNPRDLHFELDRSYYIEIPISRLEDSRNLTATTISRNIVSKAARYIILADFGSGKSMTLREIFFLLRDQFLAKKHTRFPIYINLRDHSGAKYADEILERHARDLGLADFTQLVRAWRAGFVDLLLDGFDEFAAVGWSSAPFKLRQLRRTMLEAVRRLITKSPKTVGIVAVGRLHFFDSVREMQDALGVGAAFEVLSIAPLTEELAEKLVKIYGGGKSVPDWVPSRALLLSYLAAREFLREVTEALPTTTSRGHGWDALLRMIGNREAQQHPAVDGDSVLLFIERLATIARRSSDGLGAFSEEDLSAAFQETCGFVPDDAARVLINRLPSLAIAAPKSGSRRFIDQDIADAARAGDAFRLIEAPFNSGLQKAFKDAQIGIGSNGLDRLSYLAEKRGVQPAQIEVAAEHASKDDTTAAALDILQLMMAWNLSYHRSGITISDFHFEELSFDEDVPDFSKITFQECTFESLRVPMEVNSSALPRFNRCLIGSLDGVVSLGDLSEAAFRDCEVLELSNSTARNADILQTDLPVATKVLLTVLNKLFNQAGRDRKENAFSRGLEPRARGLVPQVLNIVEGARFAAPSRVRNQVIWFPRRDKTGRVKEMISRPATSDDPLIERVRNL